MMIINKNNILLFKLKLQPGPRVRACTFFSTQAQSKKHSIRTCDTSGHNLFLNSTQICMLEPKTFSQPRYKKKFAYRFLCDIRMATQQEKRGPAQLLVIIDHPLASAILTLCQVASRLASPMESRRRRHRPRLHHRCFPSLPPLAFCRRLERVGIHRFNKFF